MAVSVNVARVNANEDQVQVIEVHVVDGQAVADGDLLYVLETTKAAVEVLAPSAGTVRGSRIAVGDFVGVGELLCEIAASLETGDPLFASAPIAGTQDIEVTAKARKLAREKGLSLDAVTPVNGRIGESEVLAAAALRVAGTVPQVSSPSILPSAGTRRAVIIGAGGHAACLIDALEQSGYDIVGCTDDSLPRGHLVHRGVTVIGTGEDLLTYRIQGVQHAFIGVGGAQSNIVRRKLFERASELGFSLPPVIHPRAIVAGGTTLGAGCHVLAGSSIGPRCQVGSNVIINQGSTVCHDSVIGDHAHITPGAILAGGVSVGAMSVVGMGATVLLGVKIGENCLIHNGAHIGSDVARGTIVDSAGRRSRAAETQEA
jgi:sugar O-acyltransferase (sialic acid O-acetyltransferase NeuD family)